MKRIISLIFSILATTTVVVAQNFNLSKFTNASGLPQNYVYSVVQDDNGFIWIGMAEGLSRYDGVRFNNFSVRDSLADNYVSQMIMDTDGILWCGHGNGRFSYYNGLKFSKLPENEEMSAPIKDMCLDDRGNIWAVEQNMGIVKISPDHKLTTYFDEEAFQYRSYSSICAVNSMTLLVGTNEGLMVVKMDVDGTFHTPEEVTDIPSAGVNCIIPTRLGKEFWICLEDGGIYRYSPTNGARLVNRCTQVCSQSDEVSYDIRSIYEDNNGDLYIGTWGDGLKEWKYMAETDNYIESLTLNEDNGLGNNYVAAITVDREGIFWFATYGGGVVAWINNYFAQYNLQDVGLVRTKIISAQIHNSRLWLGLSDGLINMDVECMSNFEYYDRTMGIPEQTDITRIIFDDKQKMQYVGTRGEGIYCRRLDEQRFRKLNLGNTQSSQQNINDITLDDNCLYIATQGGLYVYEKATGKSTAYTTNNGLPHNNINFVKLDNDGQLWFGAKDGGITLMTEDDEFETHRLADIPVDVASMTIDEYGRFWLATVNNGILCSTNDSVVSITAADGLEKNYCYGIARDLNQHIWVCHQPGLSCIDLNNGNIHTYNVSNGFGQEFNGVVDGDNGDLWFASATGVVRYIGEYDKRNVSAPIMNLNSIVVSGKMHDKTLPIDLGYPYSGDPAKLEFNFVGISMKDPTNVTYEYWLQKGEEDKDARWTQLGTQNHKEFDYLPDGDYILNIRAFNSAGIVSQRPLQISIHIDKPFWRTVWFPIFALLVVIAISRSFAKWRERKLRARQEQLEAEVARQTKEINEKKNEIERQNKDITGSIKYAERIQTAVLPSRNSLKDFPFADSFLLFRPRDIVSGDFYWFNRFGDHVLICCADCTGHGVPGAFMTLIGTTILNDAAHYPEMRMPSSMLTKLDHDIKVTLNKNTAVEMRDGMDCALIDINLKTGIMTSAAAKRPIYIIRKGQLTTIKGTRRAIGDVWNDNEFTETVTQLQDDDCIYMCSDGFIDQLGMRDGGPGLDEKGKIVDEDAALKFSTRQFTDFLRDIAEDPMEEQHKKLLTKFDKWRRNLEAVDDVIVMGIKYRFDVANSSAQPTSTTENQ